jgi:hypothetical protein
MVVISTRLSWLGREQSNTGFDSTPPPAQLKMYSNQHDTRDSHHLLLLISDSICNGINDLERHGVDFSEYTISPIRRVEVGIGAEVDKELGVAAVGHIPVRNGCRAACVGDYLVLVGLVDLQVTLWIGTVETMRPTLDDEIGSIEAGSIVELMFDELLMYTVVSGAESFRNLSVMSPSSVFSVNPEADAMDSPLWRNVNPHV